MTRTDLTDDHANGDALTPNTGFATHDFGVQCDAVQGVHVGWLSQGVVEVEKSERHVVYTVRKCQAFVRVKVWMP